MTKLYLAHPFDMRDEVRKWELGFEKRTGIELANPFYDIVKRADLNGRKDRTVEEAKELVMRDLKAIEGSDGLLAFLKQGAVSLGTPMEIQHASHALHRPVYIISSDYWMLHHPWIIAYATESFLDKEMFEEWANDNL